MSIQKTILILGGTGNLGSFLVPAALSSNYRVVLYVRNPSKIDPALKPQLTVIQGDLNDIPSLRSAIISSRPEVIIDSSSQLPGGKPANNADRGPILRMIVKTLEDEKRFNDCLFLLVGGQILPEPGGKIKTVLPWMIAGLVSCLMPKMWKETVQTIGWLFNDTDPKFRFIMVRMGHIVKLPRTKGTLVPQTTTDNIQNGSASHEDMAKAMIKLVGDETRTWERKAIFFNYN